MPKEGFTVITIRKDAYERMQNIIEKLNEKAGYEKYRSVPHFLEVVANEFYKEQMDK